MIFLKTSTMEFLYVSPYSPPRPSICGIISHAQVQQMASSAVQWCEKKGGVVGNDDLVNRMSRLGTDGKHYKEL